MENQNGIKWSEKRLGDWGCKSLERTFSRMTKNSPMQSQIRHTFITDFFPDKQNPPTCNAEEIIYFTHRGIESSVRLKPRMLLSRPFHKLDKGA